MGDKTGIQWTERTWNPWYGCHKVSQGCKNCYMFREQPRFGRDPNIVQRSKTTFDAPLSWKKHGPALVFTCSWSDWFIEDADPWRDEAWEIIKNTPEITYQILTKRPERALTHLPSYELDNVWIGISAEDTPALQKRARYLLELPFKVKFISVEPMLGPITMTTLDKALLFGYVDWIICGGESGPGCRPMEIGWARELRDACQKFGARFFMKQLGGWPNKRGELSDLPSDLRIREMPGRSVGCEK